MHLPILHYDVPLTEADGWCRAGDYWIWHGRVSVALPPYQVWRYIGGGVRPAPVRDHGLLVIPCGQTAHIEGLFGFWWRSDRDRMWFQHRDADYRYYMMVAGGLSGTGNHDDLLWYCPQCGEVLPSVHGLPSNYGQPEFDMAVILAVETFNRSPGLRQCPHCDFVHPLAYGFGATMAPPERW